MSHFGTLSHEACADGWFQTGATLTHRRHHRRHELAPRRRSIERWELGVVMVICLSRRVVLARYSLEFTAASILFSSIHGVHMNGGGNCKALRQLRTTTNHHGEDGRITRTTTDQKGPLPRLALGVAAARAVGWRLGVAAAPCPGRTLQLYRFVFRSVAYYGSLDHCTHLFCRGE